LGVAAARLLLNELQLTQLCVWAAPPAKSELKKSTEVRNQRDSSQKFSYKYS